MYDVCVLSTAREEAPGLRGVHKEEKPSSVTDYNEYRIGTDKSDQLLLCHTFQICEVEEEIIVLFLLFLNSKWPHSALQDVQSEAEII
jgi:hypothetical protein